MPQIYKAIRPMFQSNRWRIFRDDNVYIRSGRDKGMTGKVLEVMRDRRLPQVIVEGRNMRKKKVILGSEEGDYFVVTMEAPIHYSQVSLLDPSTNKPVRATLRFNSEDELVRVGRGRHASGEVIPIPKANDAEAKKDVTGGVNNTSADEAGKVTYDPKCQTLFQSEYLQSFLLSAPSSKASSKPLTAAPGAPYSTLARQSSTGCLELMVRSSGSFAVRGLLCSREAGLCAAF